MQNLEALSSSICVLVADDDSDDVFLLRRAFRLAGLPYHIIDLPDGEKAIEYLRGVPPFDDRSLYPLPGLLLLDLKMPKLNGFDVLAWLQGRPDLDHLPVVVLSASSFEADVEMAKKLGAQEFCTKPADVTDLLGLVLGLHERWLADECPVPPVSERFQNLCIRGEHPI